MQVIKEYSGVKVTVNEEDLNKRGVIYLLEFPNGKVYVGQTTQELRSRVNQHCNEKRYTTKLAKAIKAHMELKVSVLEENKTVNQLNSFEPFYIRLFNSMGEDGYNLESGGKNKTISEETKHKISQSLRGMIKSNETKNKMSKSKKNMSEETKNKMSKSKKNMSEETKNKMSQSKKKKIKSIPDGIVFDCMMDASKYYGTSIYIIKYYQNGKVHKPSGQTFLKVE